MYYKRGGLEFYYNYSRDETEGEHDERRKVMMSSVQPPLEVNLWIRIEESEESEEGEESNRGRKTMREYQFRQ